MPKKRVINLYVNPGEPLDGTGQVCIHLFIKDESGPFTEPHVLHPAMDDVGQPIQGQLVARPTRGRLACDRRRLVAPVTRGNMTTITSHTDDPRAATCPKCKASQDYAQMMTKFTEEVKE